ncbi:hypothetical protein [Maricaulis sp.]|uniref:hypothetical protein n=1 Tax=Maricaulis sp. TaxID=1486257 RepID=UPI003A90204D
MPRLPVTTKPLSFLSDLSDWQTIGKVEETVQRGKAHFGEDFVTSRDAKTLREAWIGLRYATAFGCDYMRMSDAPDMELWSALGVRQWEIVEALDPWRRRGDEYRNPTDEPVFDDCLRRRREILPTIQRRADEKAAKRYGDRTSLLIYANMGLYGAFREEVEPSLHDVTSQASQTFQEVALYWEGRVYRLWRDQRALKLEPTLYEGGLL